jgi:H+-transporting ATPase
MNLMISPAFTLPVISLVLITILNDGCMITISQDYVVPEKKPQTWRLFEATVIACVIGLVATISSVFLVVGIMHNNILNRDEITRSIASSGRNYVNWFELRAIIYLKVSVSDFLTLFSARTRGWFFERPLARLLGGAAVAALFASTMFALYWDTICKKTEEEPGSRLGPAAYMAGLRFSSGAVPATWAYCVLWWFIQDVAKVATYFVLERWEDRGFSWAVLPVVLLELWSGPPASFKKGGAAPANVSTNPLNVAEYGLYNSKKGSSSPSH